MPLSNFQKTEAIWKFLLRSPYATAVMGFWADAGIRVESGTHLVVEAPAVLLGDMILLIQQGGADTDLRYRSLSMLCQAAEAVDIYQVHVSARDWLVVGRRIGTRRDWKFDCQPKIKPGEGEWGSQKLGD